MKSEDVILSQTFRELLPSHPDMVLKLIHDGIEEKREVQPGIAWRGILVDGYVRYDICKELGIPFEITEMEFETEDEAKFFKISNQLLQRDIPVFQRCEILYPLENFVATHVAKRKAGTISNLRRGIEVCPELDKPQNTGAIIAQYAKTTRSMWYMAKRLIEEADETTKEYLRKGDLRIDTAYKNLFNSKKDDDSVSDTNEFEADKFEAFEAEESVPLKVRDKSISQSTTPTATQATTRAGGKAETEPKHKDRDGGRVTEESESDDGNNEVADTDDDIGFGRESASAVMSTQNHSNHTANDAGTGFPRACNIHFNMGAPLEAELEAELAAEEKLAASEGSADSDVSDEEDWSTDDVDIDHDPYISEIDINDPDTHLPEVVPNFPEMPKRNPIPFPLVRQQVQYSVQTMLFELLVGLCGLRDDDLDRRDEILEIVKYGFKKAKKLIERETTNR